MEQKTPATDALIKSTCVKFKPTHVYVDGPIELNDEGDFDYVVSLKDDEQNEEVIYRPDDYNTAIFLGKELAQDLKIQFINECMRP